MKPYKLGVGGDAGGEEELPHFSDWRAALEARGVAWSARGLVGKSWGIDLHGELAGAPIAGHMSVSQVVLERSAHLDGRLDVAVELPEKLPGELLVVGRGGAGVPRARRPLFARLSAPPYVDMRHVLPGFHCKGAPAERQAAMLGSAEIFKPLAAIACARLTLTRERLRVEARGGQVLRPLALLEPLEALVGALRVAALSPWRAAAARTGLDVTVGEDREPMLDGALEGCPVRVSRIDDRELLVVVTLPTSLPWALRVSAPSKRHPVGHALQPVEVPNPVLRSYVRAWCLKPEAGRDFMAHPELTAPMMAVLHGRPGSEVLSDRVVLRQPMGWPDALGIKRAVDEAVELALALEGAARATRAALRG